MGLTVSDGIIDFLKESTRVDFSDKKILLLGYQHLYITYSQLFTIAARLDIELHDDFEFANTIDVDAKDFFRLLGFKHINVMDISDYESADIIWDLNLPINNTELCSRFDYIIDGGTLEHVFNVPMALNNITKMLKLNGKVYHYVPAASYINHGFYSLSPSVFTDYYRENGFKVEDCNIILWSPNYEKNMQEHKMIHNLEDCLFAGIDYRIMDVFDGRFDKLGAYKGTLRCVASKVVELNELKTPIQRLWYDHKYKYYAIYKALQIQRYKKNEIVIWGMGDIARWIINGFETVPEFDKSVLLGFTATDCNGQDSFLGYKVIDNRQIIDSNVKLVIISTTTFVDEIYRGIKHLEKNGIKIKKINHLI